MAQYTKLSRRDIQEIAGKYELKVIDYEPIEQGVGNTNILIKTKDGKYIFTIFEIEPTEVAHMIKVLFLLEKHNYPAPRLKTMVSGEVLSNYQEKSVLIKPYIEGRVVNDLDEGKVRQVGAALAGLHEIPVPDYLPDQHTYVVKNYPQVMEQELDQNYKEWVGARYGKLMKKIPSGLPVGLCHGDVFCDNVLFEDEKIKAIIDFESVCRIDKMFDLGMAAVGVSTEGTNVPLAKVRALVKGYQEIRSIEDEEKNSLQSYIECAAILTSTWRFWKYKMEEPASEKPRTHIKMVNIAKNVSAIPSEEFMNVVFS
jgi:homoserine kinase type II